MNIPASAEENFAFAKMVRRDIHQHPELGFMEIRTASVIKKYLDGFGYKVIDQIGKTGVVGILDSGRPGKTLMMRFDMDALPIQEENETEYRSQNTGVMHGCGHDGHVAIGITIAKIISENLGFISGKVVLLFQPAEEGLGGADAMVKDGIMELIKPDAALAVHLWNEKPFGWLGITPGPLMAGADIIEIKITGMGGHGAMPKDAVDPVIAAAQVLISLQTINSKFISPFDSVVISITEIKAGDTHNVIPPVAYMRGSIRTFNKETRSVVLSRIHKITTAISTGYSCTSEVVITPLTPSVVNSTEVASKVIETAGKYLPDNNIDISYQVMASDDMAFFLEKIPGCYILIGSADEGKQLVSHHHNPNFDFVEEAMISAITLLLGISTTYLNPMS